MDNRNNRPPLTTPLTPPPDQPSVTATPLPDEPSAEEELRMAFGRVLGFTIAAIVLVVGGGVLVLVIAAIFFGFLFGH
jgi:hypothetical protein